jgi:8-oxo-dGTP pyrophosphatase MutT (NUDIX family)
MNSPPWLDRLHARAQQPPALPRQPLRHGAIECGSIEAELARRMQDAGLPLQLGGGACVLLGAPDEALAALARWMHAQGLGSPWRDELLAVTDPAGAVHAMVERAAVRPLGIATFAVHLVGYTAGGSLWVQQRAFDKATDPGQWDTLMGGLVSAEETMAQTLARETWEEAGLRLEQLHDLASLGRVTVRRPVSDGYMVEHIEMFEARLPDGLVPVNQDGEVARFDCVSVATLIERLAADEFTLEATLIHAHWLRGRALL